MDSFKVTDEGGGIIRVDADIRLVRKPIARFSNFELFDDEAIARDWLERDGSKPATLAPEGASPVARARRLALPAAAVAAGAVVLRARRHRRTEDSPLAG